MFVVRSDTSDGSDRPPGRVDSANDIVLAFRQVEDTGGGHGHAARPVKRGPQRIASISGMAALPCPSHAMNAPALQIQPPHALPGRGRYPQIVSAYDQSHRRPKRFVARI